MVERVVVWWSVCVGAPGVGGGTLQAAVQALVVMTPYSASSSSPHPPAWDTRITVVADVAF